MRPAPTGAAERNYDGDATPNEIVRHGRQPIQAVLGPTIFERDVRALGITGAAEKERRGR